MSHSFWAWSLDRYDQPGVSSSCLDLQDQHGLNVNICLWCCWLADHGRNAAPGIKTAITALEPWTSGITQVLRETRIKLKDQPHADALYKSILACELEAEHVEQNILFELAADAPDSEWSGEKTAGQALAEYARMTGVQSDFTPLLKAVFSAVKKV